MADQFGKLDLFLAVEQRTVGLSFTKPITTKQQSVFWLVSQSRRMSAICVGTCRCISLAEANGDPVVPSAWVSTVSVQVCSFLLSLGSSGVMLMVHTSTLSVWQEFVMCFSWPMITVSLRNWRWCLLSSWLWSLSSKFIGMLSNCQHYLKPTIVSYIRLSQCCFGHGKKN